MRRHLHVRTIPELPFAKQPLPGRLSSRLRETGGASLRPGSVAQLSPFPGFTFLISFFLDYLFYALVRLDKSVRRFPLPAPFLGDLAGLVSQLDFNYWFSGSRCRATSGGVGSRAEPTRVPAGRARRTEPSICCKRIEHPHVPVSRSPGAGRFRNLAGHVHSTDRAFPMPKSWEVVSCKTRARRVGKNKKQLRVLTFPERSVCFCLDIFFKFFNFF